MLTYPQWLQEQERRERWARRYRAFGDVVLVALAGFVLIGGIFMWVTAP